MSISTPSSSSGPRVLVGATGSIAVSHLPAYLDALRAEIGGSYTVVMTHSATTFIPSQTVGLSAERVVSGENPADWPTDRPSRLLRTMTWRWSCRPRPTCWRRPRRGLRRTGCAPCCWR